MRIFPLLFAFFFLPFTSTLLNGQFKPNQGKVSPHKFTEAVDFELWQDHIYLSLEVNGVKGLFMYDNGFTTTGLDPEFAAKCGIQILSTDVRKASDANNVTQDLPYGIAEKIHIGKVTFKETMVTIVDSHNFLPCKKIDGFLGNSVINKANWRIDFDLQKLLFSSEPFENDGIKTPYTITKSNRHFIEFSLNNDPYYAHIDLGSGSELELDQKKFLPLFRGSVVEEHLGISTLGLFGLGSIDTFYVGKKPFKFSYKNALFPISPAIEFQKNMETPRLGLGYLQQFNLVINSSKREYIFQNRVKPQPPLPELNYGIVFFPIKGVYKILQLISNPNVDKYHFALLEEIESLDDQPMSQYSDWCLLRTYIREKIKTKSNLALKVKGRQEVCILEPLSNKTFILK